MWLEAFSAISLPVIQHAQNFGTPSHLLILANSPLSSGIFAQGTNICQKKCNTVVALRTIFTIPPHNIYNPSTQYLQFLYKICTIPPHNIYVHCTRIFRVLPHNICNPSTNYLESLCTIFRIFAHLTQTTPFDNNKNSSTQHLDLQWTLTRLIFLLSLFKNSFI